MHEALPRGDHIVANHMSLTCQLASFLLRFCRLRILHRSTSLQRAWCLKPHKRFDNIGLVSGSICECITLLSTFDMVGRRLIGQKVFLQVGSSALKTGVTSDFFRLL